MYIKSIGFILDSKELSEAMTAKELSGAMTTKEDECKVDLNCEYGCCEGK